MPAFVHTCTLQNLGALPLRSSKASDSSDSDRETTASRARDDGQYDEARDDAVGSAHKPRSRSKGAKARLASKNPNPSKKGAKGAKARPRPDADKENVDVSPTEPGEAKKRRPEHRKEGKGSSGQKRARVPLGSRGFSSAAAPPPPKPRPPPAAPKLRLLDPYEATHRDGMQRQVLEAMAPGAASPPLPPSSTSSSSTSSSGELAPRAEKGELGTVVNLRLHPAPFRCERRTLTAAAAAAASVRREAMHLSSKGGGDQLVLGRLGAFGIAKFLGGGTYGSVFSLRPKHLDSAAGAGATGAMVSVALKVETGVRHLPWEMHVLR